VLVRALAGWRTGLSGPVIVLQAGTAVNYFGYGLIVPVEIIYLHQARGFPTATAGWCWRRPWARRRLRRPLRVRWSIVSAEADPDRGQPR
jgi:hypothetical protein